jgi:type VI secretion system protein ImpM
MTSLATMTTFEKQPGWFGKIASLGDFAHRRLSPATVQALDQWLSACLQTSQAVLGQRWLNLYLGSPVWRFAWAPGVLGAHWWFGVLMPSVDNVGRYFPLLITLNTDEPPRTTYELQQLEQWFAHMTHIALGTLLVGSTVEQLEAELARAPQLPHPIQRASALYGPAAQSSHHTRQSLAGDAPLALCLEQMAINDTLQRLQGCSVWWPVPASGGNSSLSSTKGLPDAHAYTRLLDGTW